MLLPTHGELKHSPHTERPPFQAAAAWGIALFRLSRVSAMFSAIQTAIGALLKVDLCRRGELSSLMLIYK